MMFIMQLAKQSAEEYYYADYEALGALAVEEDGFYPTPEETEAERDAACYGQDDRVLCIDEPDMTDCGQVIPEWAFG